MTKMKKVAELKAELDRWQVKYSVIWGKLYLTGGDKRARETYSDMLAEHKKMAANFILYLAKTDEDLMYSIEERASIREADGLPGDLLSAIMCSL